MSGLSMHIARPQFMVADDYMHKAGRSISFFKKTARGLCSARQKTTFLLLNELNLNVTDKLGAIKSPEGPTMQVFAPKISINTLVDHVVWKRKIM
jgi:hypothetical protein